MKSLIPKTAVIGAESFIGARMLAEYRKIYPTCVGSTRRDASDKSSYLDLADPDIAALRLVETGHKAALISAGITDVRYCQAHREFSRTINVDGILRLYHRLCDQDILPIFLSSDYVFDGADDKNYSEDDDTSPICEYGLQKALVEKEISNGSRPHLILRLSKIFGTQVGDGTFLTQAFESLSAGQSIYAASDLIFNPIFIEDVVKVITGLQISMLKGLYNVCSTEAWSRFELMLKLAERFGFDKRLVKKAVLDDLVELRLPKNISMNCQKLVDAIDCKFTSMDDCIGRIESQ